jgi:hypothetical protein
VHGEGFVGAAKSSYEVISLRFELLVQQNCGNGHGVALVGS